jgi:hypothetical protein
MYASGLYCTSDAAKGHEESNLLQVQVIVLYVKYNLYIILEGLVNCSVKMFILNYFYNAVH